MTVVHESPSAPGVSAGASRDDLDVDAAALFLRAQASWLCRGLRQAGDPTAVRIVLASHDDSHERWVSLIARARCFDDGCAQLLANLYGYHGRVAGCLERGTGHLLHRDLVTEIRRMLAANLHDLTEAAVARLQRQAGRSAGAPPLE